MVEGGNKAILLDSDIDILLFFADPAVISMLFLAMYWWAPHVLSPIHFRWGLRRLARGEYLPRDGSSFLL